MRLHPGKIRFFWFGDPQTENAQYEQQRKLWFGKDLALDQAIRAQLQSAYRQAIAGRLSAWQRSPQGCLALLLLLGQLPRNMFRGMAQAFATDNLALQVAQAIVPGFDQAPVPIQRLFFYLPEQATDGEQ